MSVKKEDIYFTVNDGGTTTAVKDYDATASFNTDGLYLSAFDGPWSVEVSRSLISGSPTITIEACNDGISWREYNEESTLLPVPELIINDSFIPKYIRLAYVANGANGTVTMKFTK